MGERIGLWNRMSPAGRGVFMVGVGAFAASAITGGTMRSELNAERADRAAAVAAATAYMGYVSVVASCSEWDAKVVAVREKDYTTRFSCVNSDGTVGQVDRLETVDPSEGPGVLGSSQVFRLKAPDATGATDVTYKLDGRDAVMTMSQSLGGIARNTGSTGNVEVTVNN